MDSSNNDSLLRTLFDAFPALVFAVNEDVQILEYNSTASKFFGKDRVYILQHRGGDAFGCLHSSDSPDGCGRGALCKDCVIRNSVNEAFSGKNTVRRRTRIEVVRGEKTVEIYALVTASVFVHQGRQLVLLIIEDISEMIELQRIIPICMGCKKVRNDEDYWSTVESYFKKHLDLDFSHGYCPECAAKEIEKLDRVFSR